MPRARTHLWYGPSGSTKTSQLYQFAKWYLAKNPSKIIRLISADGGGWAPFEDSQLIDISNPELGGRVQAFDITKRVNAYADVQKLARGYWPYKGVKPEEFKFDVSCETSKKDWTRIGAYLIEGFTSISSLWINHLRDASILPEALNAPFKFVDDDYTVNGTAPSHIGMVHKELYSITVQGFSSLPVDYVIYTALVDKGEDKRTKETIYGPQAVGHAITSEIPSWVGDCFHLDWWRWKVPSPTGELDPEGKRILQEVEGPVVWLWRHEDKQTGIPYLAKVRVLPEYVDELKKIFKFGWCPLDTKVGIGRLFERMEQFKVKLGEGVGT